MNKIEALVAISLIALPLGAAAQTPPDTGAPLPTPPAPPPAEPEAEAEDRPEPAGLRAAPEPPAPPTPPPTPDHGAPGAPAPVASSLVPSTGSSFMDTRLSFTCTHEDILREPTVLPSAPGFHCGRPNSLGILFFDNYDTRFSGFETMSHLSLYKRSLTDDHDYEAGFVVRVNEFSEDTIKLSDGGSYIRLAWFLGGQPGDKKRDQVSLVAFPVSSDRMRLGYSYRISWGGSPEFFKANPDAPGSTGKNPESVPGAKLQVDMGPAYAYVGVKSSLLLDPEINEKRSVLAGFFGAGADVNEMIHVDVNGGLIDRGKNELEDVLGEPVWLYGASFQLALHDGMAVGSSIDYALYRNSPESIDRLFRKETYPGGLSWLVSAEGTVIFQTLKDGGENATGSTTTQRGYAGDVNVRVKYERTRFKLDFMTRDLAFILHSIPSLPTYSDFPDAYEVVPEIFLSAGVDQYFPGPEVTAGLTVGLDLPATLTAPQGGVPGDLTNSTTFVVRNESDRTPLPQGEEAAAIVAVKANVRLDLGGGFAAFGDLYYQYDPNSIRYDREDPEDTFGVRFGNFHQLGFNITLQSRF